MRKLLVFVIAVSLAVPIFGQETADSLWAKLEAGNLKFIAAGTGGTLPADVTNRMPNGQSPPVSILSCADSRVPPELVFNQTIGFLFVVRTAGNVASPFDIASLEYAISPTQNWTRVIVVLGHSDCGAVKAALTNAATGSVPLDALLDRIRESFVGIFPWSTDKETLRKATNANARYAAQYLIAHSKIIRDAVMRTENPVVIIPAYYDTVTGKVERAP